MNSRGMTLIELMVASSLSAILMVAGVTVIGRGVSASGRAEAALQQIYLSQRALERLSEELRNSVALADYRFSGNSQELFFATAKSAEDISIVRWRLAPEPYGQTALVRESQPLVAERLQPFIENVLPKAQIQFQYGAIQKVEGLPTLAWFDQWDNPAPQPLQLPQLIRVVLLSEDRKGKSYRFEKDLLLPQGKLKELT